MPQPASPETPPQILYQKWYPVMAGAGGFAVLPVGATDLGNVKLGFDSMSMTALKLLCVVSRTYHALRFANSDVMNRAVSGGDFSQLHLLCLELACLEAADLF